MPSHISKSKLNETELSVSFEHLNWVYPSGTRPTHPRRQGRAARLNLLHWVLTSSRVGAINRRLPFAGNQRPQRGLAQPAGRERSPQIVVDLG
jgi:hypothetical protein